MSDIPLDKKFSVLCEITRSQHFAWREAVRQLCPGIDPTLVVQRMWEITGGQTGAAYCRHLDPSLPLPEQVARSIAWSSQCMGENASCRPGEDSHEYFVAHASCPWHRWHAERDLLAEDRAGCDGWFKATIEHLNLKLDSDLRVETLASLPDGDHHCLRRVWLER